MNKLSNHMAYAALIWVVFIISASNAIFAQNARENQKTDTAAAANVQTVDARQNGEWTIGINPLKNTVQLVNTATDPLPVKLVKDGARKPFQRRIIVTPLGNGFQTVFMEIPAGKRLIIENVSVIVRCPAGMRMETNYFTYFDNGDGQGGIAAITFHRVALIDQGVFDSTQIYTANDKTLVFAEEQIGASHYQVGVEARLNAMPPVGNFTIQAQFTFSGYLEDLAPDQ
jgi:hypothetical protein